MSSTEAKEMELSYKGPNWEADLKRIAKNSLEQLQIALEEE